MQYITYKKSFKKYLDHIENAEIENSFTCKVKYMADKKLAEFNY